MKKGLMLAVLVSTLGLAGCVAVPYDASYDYGPPVYAPPNVVVYGSYGYHGGPRRHHHHHHRR